MVPSREASAVDEVLRLALPGLFPGAFAFFFPDRRAGDRSGHTADRNSPTYDSSGPAASEYMTLLALRRSVTRPAALKTARCRDTDGPDIGKREASSPAASSPLLRSSKMRRLVESASALKTEAAATSSLLTAI
jgi:hypothetical protein